ncbi:unnamed protein product [Polarella glacialis]|uniref:Uncharacterized protein n=1 Tax=Polarella glacialis TaxID=89957 RepID=A0A813IV09_POLGL|nr:unnamed protein product [Polarella glacialis]
MPEARVVLNQITYSADISACEKDGQWQLALHSLGLMPSVRLVPDEITYSAAISACGKGSQWNEVSYNAAISVCERSHYSERGLQLLWETKGRGPMTPASLLQLSMRLR